MSWGQSMLDIGEFQKIRKRVFVDKDKIHTLSDLHKYYLDLEIICFNERSTELAELLKHSMEIAEQKQNDETIFKIYWLYFLQTYSYVKEIKNSEKIVSSMEEISSRSNNIEQLAIVLRAKSILSQIRNENANSMDYIIKAFKTISKSKEEFPETYYGTLYSYTVFTSLADRNYNTAISNMEECLSFYHEKSFNSLGLVYVINLLQRFYFLSNQEDKVDELILWVFQDQKIQSRIIDEHYISLYWYSGTIATKRYRLPEAIQYLHNAYSKIVKNKSMYEAMYEYTDIVRLLSRCYALQGQFQKSYDLLIELLDFIEKDVVKENYFEKGIKRIYFSSYTTLMFIFAQLDLDLSVLEDSKLKQIYIRTKNILSKTQLSKTLLLESSFDETDIKNMLETEKQDAQEEVNLLIHQLLITQKPYNATEDTVTKIQSIKEYAYEPFYVDVLLGKVYLAMGKQNKFLEIVKNMKDKTEEIRVPVLKIWLEFFVLLEEYISNPANPQTLQELRALEERCGNNNLKKIVEEIQLYRTLISSTKVIEKTENKFQQVAFLDVFNEQQKKIVMEYFQE
ncbi:MAG: hypothetical protein HGN29_10600 [Asgard group archaeon]|nr:hypothetical protein [Asgard group archaeon]